MSDAAATLTQDRQRLELSALSAPAVIFTVAMIAFPVVYTIWLGFQSFSSTGQQSFAGLANYAKLASDYEFWHGLWVTIALYVLSLVLQLVFGVWLALVLFHAKRLPGIVRSMFISPFMMPPVVAGMMWLVILDPVARGGKLPPAVARPAAIGVAGLAELGHSDHRADRQLAMDALCRADRARRAAVVAAERL